LAQKENLPLQSLVRQVHNQGTVLSHNLHSILAPESNLLRPAPDGTSHMDQETMKPHEIGTLSNFPIKRDVKEPVGSN